MNRSPSVASLPIPSSPLVPTEGPDAVKRRKSHQWFLGSSRLSPSTSRSGMPSGANLLSPNPARIMLERRHSYQNTTSRIPRVRLRLCVQAPFAYTLAFVGIEFNGCHGCSDVFALPRAYAAHEGSRDDGRPPSPSSCYFSSVCLFLGLLR